ncbi:MAG: reverse transcriptase domain-containing protein [Acidobacteriota bacterium]|nr:reverse transcriptase domain-containing protein [Acidobacteriota bacterium]
MENKAGVMRFKAIMYLDQSRTQAEKWAAGEWTCVKEWWTAAETNHQMIMRYNDEAICAAGTYELYAIQRNVPWPRTDGSGPFDRTTIDYLYEADEEADPVATHCLDGPEGAAARAPRNDDRAPEQDVRRRRREPTPDLIDSTDDDASTSSESEEHAEASSAQQPENTADSTDTQQASPRPKKSSSSKKETLARAKKQSGSAITGGSAAPSSPSKVPSVTRGNGPLNSIGKKKTDKVAGTRSTGTKSENETRTPGSGDSAHAGVGCEGEVPQPTPAEYDIADTGGGYDADAPQADHAETHESSAEAGGGYDADAPQADHAETHENSADAGGGYDADAPQADHAETHWHDGTGARDEPEGGGGADAHDAHQHGHAEAQHDEAAGGGGAGAHDAHQHGRSQRDEPEEEEAQPRDDAEAPQEEGDATPSASNGNYTAKTRAQVKAELKAAARKAAKATSDKGKAPAVPAASSPTDLPTPGKKKKKATGDSRTVGSDDETDEDDAYHHDGTGARDEAEGGGGADAHDAHQHGYTGDGTNTASPGDDDMSNGRSPRKPTAARVKRTEDAATYRMCTRGLKKPGLTSTERSTAGKAAQSGGASPFRVKGLGGTPSMVSETAGAGRSAPIEVSSESDDDGVVRVPKPRIVSGTQQWSSVVSTTRMVKIRGEGLGCWWSVAQWMICVDRMVRGDPRMPPAPEWVRGYGCFEHWSDLFIPTLSATEVLSWLDGTPLEAPGGDQRQPTGWCDVPNLSDANAALLLRNFDVQAAVCHIVIRPPTCPTDGGVEHFEPWINGRDLENSAYNLEAKKTLNATRTITFEEFIETRMGKRAPDQRTLCSVYITGVKESCSRTTEAHGMMEASADLFRHAWDNISKPVGMAKAPHPELASQQAAKKQDSSPANLGTPSPPKSATAAKASWSPDTTQSPNTGPSFWATGAIRYAPSSYVANLAASMKQVARGGVSSILAFPRRLITAKRDRWKTLDRNLAAKDTPAPTAPAPRREVKDEKANRLRRVQAAFLAGHLSRGMHILLEKCGRQLDTSDIPGTVDELKTLHPAASGAMPAPIQVDQTDAVVTPEQVRDSIKQTARGEAPGASGLSSDVLWQAIEYEEKTGHSHDPDSLLSAITVIVRAILQGNLTLAEANALRDIRLICIPKLKKAGIRPISMSEVIVKVTARVAMQDTYEIEKMLPDQFGIIKGGAERAIFIVQDAIRSGKTCLTFDASNAYQELFRSTFFGFLRATNQAKMARIKAYTNFVYGCVSHAFWEDPNGKIHKFDVSRGVRQGCPVAPLLFCIGIQGVLDEIRAAHGVRIIAYLDDLCIIGETTAVDAAAADLILRLKEKAGLRIRAEHDSRKGGFFYLGAGLSYDPKEAEHLLAKFRNLDDYREFTAALEDLPPSQQLALLRVCGVSKAGYIARCHGDEAQGWLRAFDKVITDRVARLAQCHPSAVHNNPRVTLPTRMGGLGMTNWGKVGGVCHKAARDSAQQSVYLDAYYRARFPAANAPRRLDGSVFTSFADNTNASATEFAIMLKRHLMIPLASHHINDRRLPCKGCGKEFTVRDLVNTHAPQCVQWGGLGSPSIRHNTALEVFCRFIRDHGHPAAKEVWMNQETRIDAVVGNFYIDLTVTWDEKKRSQQKEITYGKAVRERGGHLMTIAFTPDGKLLPTSTKHVARLARYLSVSPKDMLVRMGETIARGSATSRLEALIYAQQFFAMCETTPKTAPTTVSDASPHDQNKSGPADETDSSASEGEFVDDLSGNNSFLDEFECSQEDEDEGDESAPVEEHDADISTAPGPHETSASKPADAPKVTTTTKPPPVAAPLAPKKTPTPATATATPKVNKPTAAQAQMEAREADIRKAKAQLDAREADISNAKAQQDAREANVRRKMAIGFEIPQHVRDARAKIVPTCIEETYLAHLLVDWDAGPDSQSLAPEWLEVLREECLRPAQHDTPQAESTTASPTPTDSQVDSSSPNNSITTAGANTSSAGQTQDLTASPPSTPIAQRHPSGLPPVAPQQPAPHTNAATSSTPNIRINTAGASDALETGRAPSATCTGTDAVQE